MQSYCRVLSLVSDFKIQGLSMAITKMESRMETVEKCIAEIKIQQESDRELFLARFAELEGTITDLLQCKQSEKVRKNTAIMVGNVESSKGNLGFEQGMKREILLFDGGNAFDWISKIKECLKFYNFATEGAKVLYASFFLIGSAREWWCEWRLEKSEVYTLEEFFDAISLQFGTTPEPPMNVDARSEETFLTEKQEKPNTEDDKNQEAKEKEENLGAKDGEDEQAESVVIEESRSSFGGSAIQIVQEDDGTKDEPPETHCQAKSVINQESTPVDVQIKKAIPSIEPEITEGGKITSSCASEFEVKIARSEVTFFIQEKWLELANKEPTQIQMSESVLVKTPIILLQDPGFNLSSFIFVVLGPLLFPFWNSHDAGKTWVWDPGGLPLPLKLIWVRSIIKDYIHGGYFLTAHKLFNKMSNITTLLSTNKIGSKSFIQECGILQMLGSRFNDPSAFAMNQKLGGKPLHRERANVRMRKKRKLIIFIGVAVAGVGLLAFCCGGFIYSLKMQQASTNKLRQRVTDEKTRSPTSASSGRGSGENRGPGFPNASNITWPLCCRL